MLTHLRQRFAPCSTHRAARALAAYHSHPDHAPALAALLGHRQLPDRARGLVDGPQRLVIVTAETIALVDPISGLVRKDAPLAQLAAYRVDTEGRFIIRFDSSDGPSRVVGFRPLAAPDPTLTTCQAAGLFVQHATAAWETRIGRPFTNGWTAPTIAAVH